ncbi:MAG: helix-turn-helix transcriptional regulator [Vallitaleaceae bacterium]|jgi:transcriptional regulator with XRE-family HTH domain|nr:helix-turn-helix transcriptional regulator [Vallitaleaceae bacterium]
MFNSYDMKAFGHELKELRSKCNLSQKTVSLMSKVSEDTLRRIENGYVVPRYDTIVILSALYRTNLLDMLNRLGINSTLFNYYEIMDTAMISNDLELLADSYNDLATLLSSNMSSQNLVYYDELKQILVFFELIQYFYEDPGKYTDKIMNSILAIFQERYPEYTIQNYAAYHYSFVELRLLLLFCLVYSNYDIKHCNEICLFMYDLLNSDTPDHHTYKILIKIIYKISYNYYTMEDDEMCIKYADIGITMANANNSSYLLADLLIRKGIALNYLHHPDAYKYIKYSIDLLAMTGQVSKSEEYKKITENVHHIKLDK